MLFKNMVPLWAILFLVNCNNPVIEKCEVGNIAVHPLTSSHHPSVANGTFSNDSDPDNDLKDLDESLYNKAAVYNLSIKVGSTFQEVDVVADTGSSDLVLSQSYKPASSATPILSADNQQQSISLSYGSCAGQAVPYEDNVGLQCGEPVKQSFAYLSAGSTCPNIMGLAYKKLSNVCDVLPTNNPNSTCTFFGDLVNGRKIQNVFSMLLCGKKPGSQIVLGGHVKNAPLAALQFTPILEESYYVMNALSMSTKGGLPLGSLEGETVILDSGTTLSVVPTDIHDRIVAAVQAANPNIPENFFLSTKPSDEDYTIRARAIGDFSKLPTFTLTLAGMDNGAPIVLDIPPQVYLKDMGNDNFIFGFRKAAQGEIVIFGQTLMDNFYIVFDRENKQIGFAPQTGLCGA